MMDSSSSVSSESVPVGNPCGVCGKESPYKCPICLMKYCTSTCFKSHKASDLCSKDKHRSAVVCDTEVVECNQNLRTYSFPTEDTIPKDKLELLSNEENLPLLKEFLRDPKVKASILKLDRSANPTIDIQDAMDYDNFVKFSQWVTDLIYKS